MVLVNYPNPEIDPINLIHISGLIVHVILKELKRKKKKKFVLV